MTLTEAQDCLTAHLTDAQHKYEPIRDRGEALRRISDYVTKAAADHNSGEDSDKPARFAQRIGQVGGLCLRALIDLDAVHAIAGDTCPHCGK